MNDLQGILALLALPVDHTAWADVVGPLFVCQSGRNIRPRFSPRCLVMFKLKERVNTGLLSSLHDRIWGASFVTIVLLRPRPRTMTLPVLC